MMIDKTVVKRVKLSFKMHRKHLKGLAKTDLLSTINLTAKQNSRKTNSLETKMTNVEGREWTTAAK